MTTMTESHSSDMTEGISLAEIREGEGSGSWKHGGSSRPPMPFLSLTGLGSPLQSSAKGARASFTASLPAASQNRPRQAQAKHVTFAMVLQGHSAAHLSGYIPQLLYC